MFSRSTAPAAWVSGNDSIGRHARCCSMSVSAWAGVRSDMCRQAPGLPATRQAQRSGGLLVLLGGLVLGLPHAQLLVETIGNRLQLLHGGVVFLVLHAGNLGLLLGRVLGLRGDLGVVLALDAGQVRFHVLVVLNDLRLGG